MEVIFKNTNRYSTPEFKTKSIDYCCQDMKKAVEERFIFFGEYDPGINTNTDINIAHCNPFREGACWDEMPIQFCPFCGTRIIVHDVSKEGGAN
jgi:hypothetical protein